MKAVWHGTVVADSDDTLIVDGNHYFPAASVRRGFLLSSNTKTMSSTKGQASYWTLFVDGDTNPDAAWTYPEPREGFESLRDRFAFWKGVQIVD